MTALLQQQLMSSINIVQPAVAAKRPGNPHLVLSLEYYQGCCDTNISPAGMTISSLFALLFLPFPV
jgi:hypothetical protein